MVHKTKEAVAKTAYGKTLENDVKFKFEWDAFSDYPELQSANALLTATEQLKARNTERKNKARAAALTAALDAAGIIKPTLENDEQLRLREMFKVLMSGKKYTEEQARDLASKTLGIEWDDDDED